MSFLDKITTGIQKLPPRILIHGTEGIGKSTFAANAKKPIFIQTETGTDNLDVARFPAATCYDDVVAQLTELIRHEHDYGTIVIDTIDALEQIIHTEIIAGDPKASNINQALGGYGAGHRATAEKIKRILSALDILRNKKNMTCIVISHSVIERIEDPEVAPYDTATPNLHKHSRNVINYWADAILYAYQPRRVMKIEGENTRAVSRGERQIRVTGTPAYVAKNRYGMQQDSLPLEWRAFIDAAFPGKK